MCGIAGIWPVGGDARETVEGMLRRLAHRGPDGSDVLDAGPNAPVFGHRRLAIVDLSAAGRQPMRSASDRYLITLNGEIYNHVAVRQALETAVTPRPVWRGHSDTEILLAAIDHWGLDAALARCTGMFAFALWDQGDRSLTLVRDRFGEKPLYWSVTAKGLVFASELKALIGSGHISTRINRDAVAVFLRHNNIPAPLTVFEHVQKLQPGHTLRFSGPTNAGIARAYWSVAGAWQQGRQRPYTDSDEAATDSLEKRLSAVLRDQMQADVPLGAFLSGGIDSSTIVALMQSQAGRPVRTFSIGFPVVGYNEAEAAAAVARHLGTEHTELYVQLDDALGVIQSLPTMYCEPFADSSQIPTYLVAKMARQHVTVALSGDAGDELFGGYNRYLFGPAIRQRLQSWPMWARRAVAGVIDALPPSRWDALIHAFDRWISANARFADAGDKLAKLARALRARDDAELYESFISQWEQPALLVAGAHEARAVPDWAGLGLGSLSFVERMMLQDATGYLPNDILTKVDRASMAVGLEARVPFLDHGLYEFAASLPMHLKVRGGVTKWLLREVLYRHVPRELIDRPKTGFGIPIHAWLRHELRDWAESLLSREALLRSGLFEPEPVRAAWSRHLRGLDNLQHPLWCVLMFQAWHAEWASSLSADTTG